MTKFRTDPTAIVIHHSASVRESVNAEEIRKWHLERGSDDIGYHYVITMQGLIEQGRDLAFQGAHCRAGGMNRKSIGICLVGDSTKQVFKPGQFLALEILIGYLRYKYNSKLDIYQHSDFESAKPYCAGLTEDQLEDLCDFNV